MAWWEALAAVGGAAGSTIGGYNSARQANDANRELNENQMIFNAEQARINRDFQERMSNSAWQRGIADMKAAGINPIAAFSSGGASTPSGGSANTGALKSMDQVPNITGAVLSSALEIARTFAELNRNKATVINLKTDTELKRAQEQDTYMTALHKTMLNKMIDAQLPSAWAQSYTDWMRHQAEKESGGFGKWDAWMRRFSGPLSNWGNSAFNVWLGSKLPRVSKRIP